MGLDHRIGSKFLHAGPGFGGSCFPKDVAALIETGEQHGAEMQIAKAAAAANERQKLAMVVKIKQALGGLKGKTVGVLGLSFKPNTNDLRESPALTIIEGLLKEGCAVRAHDPAALEEGMKLLPKITPCADPYEAAEGSDALVLMTEWNQFRNLEFDRLRTLLRQPLLIDLRNVYEPERVAGIGFRYVSVGQATREPKKSS
jgi:UDPglucose 6-dehydrogenase